MAALPPNFPEAVFCNGIGLLEKHLSKLKRLTICSVGEDVGKWALSSMTDGSINPCGIFGG